MISSLCNWLNSKNRAESNKNFTVYYADVSKLLRPTLNRQLNDEALAEDLLQNLFIKLFERLTKKRPHGYQRVMALIPLLDTSNTDIFVKQSLTTWGQQVSNWSEEMWCFCERNKGLCHERTHDEVYALNQQHIPLKHQGKAFLEDLADYKTNPSVTKTDSLSEVQDKPLYSIISELNVNMPLLQLPLKPLLFQMANNMVIDHFRTPHKKIQEDSLSTSEDDDTPELSATISGPRTEEPEHSQLVSDVQRLLQVPFRKIEADLKNAKGRKDYEQLSKKLEECYKDYLEQVAIIELSCLGKTQIEIAELLGITRDQVRYRKATIAELLLPLKNTNP